MGEFWGLDGVNGFAAFNFSIYIAIRYLYISVTIELNLLINQTGKNMI